MAITLLEYSRRLNGVIDSLQGNDFGNTMGVIGSEALTMIRKRVTGTGKDADGSGFSAYSTKDMLVGAKSFYKSAAATTFFGSKKKRRELDWVTVKGHSLAVLEGGYKKLRELQGFQTGFVDFKLSARMWTNIKLTSDKSELNTGVAVIKATTDLDKAKLAGNTERKGDILELSKSELSRIKELYDKGVEEAFRKNQLL